MATATETVLEPKAPVPGSEEEAKAKLEALRTPPEVSDETPIETPTEVEEEIEEIEAPEEDEALDEIVDPSEEVDELVKELVEEETPSYQAPAEWTSDGKAEFEALPDEIKADIVKRDRDRNRQVQKKLSEEAERRKQTEATLAEAQQLRDQYQEQLSAAVTVDAIPEPDIELLDPDSDNYDPDGYHLQKARADKARSAQAERQKEAATLAEQQAKEQAKLVEEEKAKSAAQLQEWFPSWKEDNGNVGRKAVGELRGYLVEQGIAQEVAQGVYDATMLKLTWKARQYDRIKKKETSAKPRPKKGGKPSSRKVTPKKADVTNLKSNLKESGSEADALALLKATRT